MDITKFADDQISHQETISSKLPETVNPQTVLENQDLLRKFPHDHLYSHQAKALEELDEGNNVCVTTPTSSGKTLIYGLDIARRWIQDNDSTFLLVYPTKALSRDQEKELKSLYDELELDITVGVYDGDASRGEKRSIRQSADVVITNFQGLNYYLPHHEKWSRIFENLQTIVIDEAHTYSGIHGVHVALIIRRLRRLAEVQYHAAPSMILSSATIGNPDEHATNLTGDEFTVIDEDGSPRGQRELVLWNPPGYVDGDGEFQRRSSNKESSDLLSHFVTEGLQTLMFTRSRRSTELCAKWTSESIADEYTVDSYHAGYPKADRREIENNFKRGVIDGVISTNALELGIDIGDIDATIMNGYPKSKASFWQQAGRSGRGTSNAISVFVAQHNSVDQYIIDNPNYLLNTDVEDAVIDLSNEHVLRKHVRTAANEMPINNTTDFLKYFSETPIYDVILDLKQDGVIAGDVDAGVFTYDGQNPRPETDIDLYSSSDDQYTVFIDFGDDTQEIPPVDKNRAFRDLHPHAIYMYNGTQYKVATFDQENQEIYLEYADNVDYYTQSSTEVTIRDIRETESEQIHPSITMKRGTAKVSQSYPTYSKVYFNKGNRESNLPTGLTESLDITTQIIWFEIEDDLRSTVRQQSGSDGVAGSLHAMEHALIKMAPTEITADTDDIGGLSTITHDETNKATVFIYDGIDGGVGFAHKIYDNIATLAEKTETMLKTCDCDSNQGCPACTMSSSCGDNNEPMDSQGAQYLLNTIHQKI